MTARVEVPYDFICPISDDLIIRPIKTQCNHTFEQSPLATWFEQNKTCPLCRREITNASYDEDLAKRIKNEFLTTKANIKYYEDVKKSFSTLKMPDNMISRIKLKKDIKFTILTKKIINLLKKIPKPTIPSKLRQSSFFHTKISNPLKALNRTTLKVTNFFIERNHLRLAGFFIKITKNSVSRDLLYYKIARRYLSSMNLKKASGTCIKIHSTTIKDQIFYEITLKAFKAFQFYEAFSTMLKLSKISLMCRVMISAACAMI